MERVDRLKTAYSYLMSKGIARKQQDVVNKMKKPKSSVYKATKIIIAFGQYVGVLTASFCHHY